MNLKIYYKGDVKMELNNYIDHTNLKVISTLKDIEKLCNEAIKYHFASVCVSPYYVKLAKNLLKDSTVSVCTILSLKYFIASSIWKRYFFLSRLFL